MSAGAQRRWLSVALGLLTVLCFGRSGHAQVSARDLQTATEQLPDGGRRFLAHLTPNKPRESSSHWAKVPLLLELKPGQDPPAQAQHITGRSYVVHAALPQFAELRRFGKVSVSDLRYPHMSLAQPRVQADHATEDYGLTGTGCIVGIVDT